MIRCADSAQQSGDFYREQQLKLLNSDTERDLPPNN